MRFPGAMLLVLLLGAVPAAAQEQDRTLADIRQELSVLQVELQRLNRELSTTEGARAPDDGGGLRDRAEAVESELQRIIDHTERLELRIERVVEDGTRRLSDIEFRLVELEGGDISAIEDTPPLGGEAGRPMRNPGLDTGLGAGLEGLTAEERGDAAAGADTPQMAVSEQADFDAARAALEDGRHDEAAEKFAAFTEAYPGGPLTAEAYFRLGQAHDATGRDAAAARAWLDAYSAEPDGANAPPALYRLGRALDALGQRQEACVMFFELTDRFADSDDAARAETALRELDCN